MSFVSRSPRDRFLFLHRTELSYALGDSKIGDPVGNLFRNCVEPNDESFAPTNTITVLPIIDNLKHSHVNTPKIRPGPSTRWALPRSVCQSGGAGRRRLLLQYP